MDRKKLGPVRDELVEDRTGWLHNFIKRRRDQFLVNMGLAKHDQMSEWGEMPPLIKIGNDEFGQPAFDESGFNNVEWTPEENKMLKKGMSPQDLFILRGYKQMPGLVGK